MRIFSSIRSSLFVLVLLGLSAAAYAQIGISISLAPPELPTYEQPLCPGDGYLWTPGYWAYGDADAGYYWVPGAWVMAPEPGFLWTPGYWGWGGNGYAFNEGYWGLHVGFYGGVSYGFGYFGNGFEGGRWQGGQFYYNRSVSNINITSIHNVYNTTVVHNNVESRVSFNGGTGGIDRRPTAQEESFSHERHIPPVAAQGERAQAARSNPEQRASVIRNTSAGAGMARSEPSNTPRSEPAKETGMAKDNETARPENNSRPENAVHPNDLPARQPYTAPSTGNAARDHKVQQNHDKLAAKQDQESQKLQQKQDQDHQRQAAQQTSEANKQNLEKQHQQQTQKLQQKHTQQEQKMQGNVQRGAPAASKHAGI